MRFLASTAIATVATFHGIAIGLALGGAARCLGTGICRRRRSGGRRSLL